MNETKTEDVDQLAEVFYTNLKDEVGPLFRAAIESLPTEGAEVLAVSVIRVAVAVLMEQMVVRNMDPRRVVDVLLDVGLEVAKEIGDQDEYMREVHRRKERAN